jgi:histidine triad (HIT) family protein
MTFDPECDFCAIVANEEPAREVFRDEHVVAFFPIEPATLGHTLIVPRNHIPNIWSLSGDAADHLTRSTLLVARAIRESLDIEGMNIIQSNGEAATQETDWSDAAKADTQREVRAGVQAVLNRSEA